jgi:hypothetical protein
MESTAVVSAAKAAGSQNNASSMGLVAGEGLMLIRPGMSDIKNNFPSL